MIDRVDGDVQKYTLDPQTVSLMAAGGHEIRALMLGLMDPESPQTIPEIRNAINEAQDVVPSQNDEQAERQEILSAEDWYIEHTLAYYHMKGLINNGLAFVDISGSRKNGKVYGLTQEGRTTGRSLAGHMIDLSVHSEYSLIDIFYNANPKIVAGRIAVMAAVLDCATAKGVRIADVADKAHMDHRKASKIVHSLGEKGIASVQSIEAGKASVRYAIHPAIDGFNPDHHNSKAFYKDLVQLIQKLRTKNPELVVTNKDLAELMMDEFDYDIPLVDAVQKVAKSTVRLRDKGLLKQEQVVQGGKSRSLVKLSEGQLIVIEHMLDIYNWLEEGHPDFIEHGEELLAENIDQPDLVHYVIGKARDASIGVKSNPDENELYTEEIIRIVKASGQPLAVNQICKELFEAGHGLSPATVRTHLRDVRDSGAAKLIEKQDGLKQTWAVAA